jgi:hypothetical protein
MKKHFKKIIFLFAGILFLSTMTYAQPGPGPGPGPGGGPPGPAGGAGDEPPCWPPPCVPVDGGITFLIALGAAYGGKKAYDKFKKDDPTHE